MTTESLPVRGAWIEISCAASASVNPPCRSPCGERGLKFDAAGFFYSGRSRSPCGERGLKLLPPGISVPKALCRSPCGERGLKSRHS